MTNSAVFSEIGQDPFNSSARNTSVDGDFLDVHYTREADDNYMYVFRECGASTHEGR